MDSKSYRFLLLVRARIRVRRKEEEDEAPPRRRRKGTRRRRRRRRIMGTTMTRRRWCTRPSPIMRITSNNELTTRIRNGRETSFGTTGR
jgi:hypothetical protein